MGKTDEIEKAGKFAIVGIANTLIDMGIFTLLAQVLNVNVYFSQCLSFTAGVLNSYIFNKNWTFKAKDSFWSPALVRFLILNVMMLFVSTFIIWLFYDIFSFHKLIAKCISIPITMVINFLVSRLWVFST